MDATTYYEVVDGEMCVSAAGIALLLGVPKAEFDTEARRQQGDCQEGQSFMFRMPAQWARQGRRHIKECEAALGRALDLVECIDYLAAKAGLSPEGA